MSAWLNPSALFGEIDAERELETEQARLRRLAAIRSRARSTQQPIVVLVEPSVAPEWTKALPQRRRILTTQERRSICRELRAGRGLLPTLQEAGVSRTVYYRHLSSDPSFRADVDAALGRASQDAEDLIWTQLEVPGHTMGRREIVTGTGRIRESSCCSCGWLCPSAFRSRAGVIAAWKQHVEASAR